MPLANVLPVRMQASDDRVNAPQPCLLEKRIGHPILDGLPLAHPPGIGGYNLVRAGAGAQVATLIDPVYRRVNAYLRIAGVDCGAAGQQGDGLCRTAVVLQAEGVEQRIE